MYPPPTTAFLFLIQLKLLSSILFYHFNVYRQKGHSQTACLCIHLLPQLLFFDFFPPFFVYFFFFLKSIAIKVTAKLSMYPPPTTLDKSFTQLRKESFHKISKYRPTLHKGILAKLPIYFEYCYQRLVHCLQIFKGHHNQVKSVLSIKDTQP